MPVKEKIVNIESGREDSEVISLAKALKGSSVTSLDLSFNRIGCKGLKYLAKILGDTQIRILTLSSSGIKAEGLKYLSKFLPDTEITELHLGFNNLGNIGLKYLTQVLSDTKITQLELSETKITDESLKYLVDTLKSTQVTNLDLRGNLIGIDGAQHLIETLVGTKVKYWFNIWLPSPTMPSVCQCDEDSCTKWITVSTIRCPKIELHEKTSMREAPFLRNIIKMLGITEVVFDERAVVEDDVEYLTQAFENIQIKKLQLSGLVCPRRKFRFFAETFNPIVELTICKVRTIADVQLLSEFLREVKVISLELGYYSNEDDEVMEYLTLVLKNSDIMGLDLSHNGIGDTGAKYLAEILPLSKIVSLNLEYNKLGNEGVRLLARSLPCSQVTSLCLHRNEIRNEGYQYLIDVLDDTNLTYVTIYENNIKARLESETEYISTASRITAPYVHKICDVFEKLVSFDPASKSFDFTVPDCLTDINEFPFLMKTLVTDNPNSKVHIFKKMCMEFCGEWDFNLINKINEFITEMPSKFNTFFNSKLPELIQLLGNYDFVDLVKHFEKANLFDVVENLLGHRDLYYVDEKQEILHPYIYNMLHEYKIPLYEDQLKPNKRENIISFYQSHPEIDGAQELIDLLTTLSLSN